MSPSESDLRAALHDGEGGGPNIDLLIMRAEARAAQRRTRLLSAAVVVGVVASAGMGIGFLSGHSSKDDTSGNSLQAQAAAGSHAARPSVRAGLGSGAGGSNGGAAASGVAGCPSDAGAARTPVASAAAHTSMFSSRVSTVVLCAYSELMATDSSHRNTASSPDQVVLHGAQASQLVQSLKRAPKVRPTDPCPMVRTASRPLVIYAYTATGTVAGVASTDLGVPVCNVVSFSNSDVRYNWTAPFDLAPIMGNLAPVAAPTPRPTH